MFDLNVYLIFLILSQFLIIFYFEKISNYFNFFDIPDKERKKHTKKTSLLGGSIIFFTLVFCFVLFLTKDKFIINDQIFFKNNTSYIYFSIACLLIYIVGLIDDKYNLNYFVKIIVTTLIVSIFIFFEKDTYINIVYLSFYEYPIDTSKIALFFTTLCFLLFINSLNMFDGIDGQVGLYSLFLLNLILFFTGNNYLIIFLIFGVITFLFLNFKKKCFLGDNGTLLLGFIFSFLMIKLYNQNFIYHADKIFLIMIIPGLDMLRLFTERLSNKKNPFKGDSNHIHHLLIAKFGYYKALIYVQIIIVAPVIASFYYNLLLINFISILVYFLTITVLKSSKNRFSV